MFCVTTAGDRRDLIYSLVNPVKPAISCKVKGNKDTILPIFERIKQVKANNFI